MIIDPSTFTLWASMRNRVLAKAPEAPSFRIDDALKDAAQQFFETSKVWRSSRDTLLTTVAATLDYAFTAPTNAEVAEVFSAWVDDDELGVVHPGDHYDADQTTTTDDYKVGARATDMLYLTQLPATAAVEVVGVLIFKPSTAAVGIPSQAWDRWAEEIACGAAALLVSEPLKPWSQPGTFSMLRRKFEEGVQSASESAGPARRESLRSLAV